MPREVNGSMMDTSTFEVSSYVRGHHIYKSVWTPIISEELDCVREINNIRDRYTVAVVKNNEIVGHLHLSCLLSLY